MAGVKNQHRLNEKLRAQLVDHVTELYFPAETEDLATVSLRDMFQTYLKDTFGPAPFYMPVKYSVRDRWNNVLFSAPWAKLPFVTLDASQKVYVIDLDSCPVPGFTETARALLLFLRQKNNFYASLSGELLRYATTETFLRRFPILGGAFAEVIEPEAVDLPVAVTLDMSVLGQFDETTD